MAYKAPSDHEMTVASQHEMAEMKPDTIATALLSDEEQDTSRASSVQRYSKFRDFLRQTRLQILKNPFRRLSNTQSEPRKVAMYSSRRLAAFHCLLHMIPLGGAMTLLVLRWTHYWVGFNPPDATTLQFVAKLHELLMQVSIVEIILCIVRSEATQGFVPLGALSGAVQATQLSYLWSLDFVSLFTSNAFRQRKWQKARMIVVLPALLISTALVGPSSAILMIPETGCSKEFQRSDLYVKSVETVFPTQLGVADGFSMDIPSMSSTLERIKTRVNDNFRDGRTETELLYPDPSPNDRLLRLSLSQLPTIQTLLPGRNITRAQATAVIPTSLVNEELTSKIGFGSTASSSKGSADAKVSIEMPLPVASVVCTHSEYGSGATSREVYYTQKDGASLGIIGNLSSVAPNLSNRSTVDDYGYQYFEPAWLNSPEPGSKSVVVVLITGITNTTEPQSLEWLLTKSGEPVSVIACSLSAYWKTAESSLILERGYARPTQTRSFSELKLDDLRDITLNLTGVPGIDTLLDGKSNISSISREAEPWTRDDGPHVDLATVFALALSDLPSFRNVQYGPDHLSPEFLNQYSAFHRSTIWYAYGYTTDSTNVRLSLAAILAYCITTTAYLIYILVTGLTSTAWNSAIELVALALQSKKPDYPGRIAVGIDSLETLNQGVGIRVNKDDELELVFASDRDIGSRGLRKIEKNMVY